MPKRTHWLVPVLLLAAAPALAASGDWQVVGAPASGGTVELDLARIERLKGGKTAAWSRLTLDQPVLDFENRFRYASVEALNHYDCAKNTYSTQKRVFRLAGREMRSESVGGPQIAVRPGSLDARLLDAVCRPSAPSIGQDNRPRVMHAELVSAGEAAAPKMTKVADAAAAVPDRPAEKPRLFEMPQIDKSKAEDPYKNAPPAAAKPAPKAAFPAIPPQVQELSRQQREMMLATSGLRKAAPKKQEKPAQAQPPAPDYSHVHWGYAGPGAPENWGKLRADYATCATGKRQSPIDIRGGVKVDLEPIKFDYRPSQFRIVDNGHTVQVDVGEGSSLTVMGRRYALVQFHFHRPAEERVNGRSYEMVAHLVHRDYANNLAVVAVLMDRGMEHPVIQTLWNHLPLDVGMEVMPPEVVIDPARLLPEKREYYTYMGSLTTPPCTENVLWMVLKEPIGVSPEQIGIFARLYPYNARPVQPGHDRLIKESR